MRLVAIALVVLVLVACSAMIWQHSRYVDVRRNLAHDRQPSWHSSGVFHVLVFVTTAPGTDLIEELRALKRPVVVSSTPLLPSSMRNTTLLLPVLDALKVTSIDQRR